VIVLVRDPQDAVLEFVIRRPSLSIAQALRGYARFYEPLLRYRDSVAVGTFAQVTSDFGAVIRRVNERFGTEFTEFQHTDRNVRACFDAIEQHYRTLYGPERFEHVVARPSKERERLKGTLRAAYEAAPEGLRSRATALYVAFAGDDWASERRPVGDPGAVAR
jgi:hypothetical protein